MKERKYPKSLFIIGFTTNVIFHFFWLFVPCIILLIVGIFVKPCSYIGLALFIIDMFLSFIEQMKIRKAFLVDSDNPGFHKFQEALSKEGSWIKNMKELTEEQINVNLPEEDKESKSNETENME